MGAILKLNNVRLAFPHLFVPTKYKDQGDAKFRAVFILGKDHPQFMEVQKTILSVAQRTTRTPARFHGISGRASQKKALAGGIVAIAVDLRMPCAPWSIGIMSALHPGSSTRPARPVQIYRETARV